MPHHDAPVRLDDVVGRVVAVEGDHLRRIDTNLAQVAGRLAAGTAKACRGPRPRGMPRRGRHESAAPTSRHRLSCGLRLGQMTSSHCALLAPNRPIGRRRASSPQDILLAQSIGIWSRNARFWGQIGPQVCIAARGHQGSRPPKQALHALCQQYVANLSRNRRALHILDAVLERLEAVGIAVLGTQRCGAHGSGLPGPSSPRDGRHRFVSA